MLVFGPLKRLHGLGPFDVVDSGRLFDYEGNWSAERWRDLQSEAANDHDVLIVPDFGEGRVFPSFIVFDHKNIKSAEAFPQEQINNAIGTSGDYDLEKSALHDVVVEPGELASTPVRRPRPR